MNTATWMMRNVSLFTDNITGEVDESGLAELYCAEHGRALEPDGSVPQGILDVAYRIAVQHEYKTGARVPRINPKIGEFMNHVDSNFQFPKINDK